MLQIFFVTVLILSITSAVNSDNCQVENCPSIAASQAGTPLLPIPSDCTKYVQCDNGFPRTVSCPSGLQFNNNAQVCDWPLNVNCVPCDNSEPNSANSDPTSTTDTNSEITTENSTTQNSSTANNLCVSATPEHYLFPLVTDCTKFISCSNGVPYVMNCPQGLHFNDVLSVCDWPASANCTAVTTTTTSTIGTTEAETISVETSTVTETTVTKTLVAETTEVSTTASETTASVSVVTTPAGPPI